MQKQVSHTSHWSIFIVISSSCWITPPLRSVSSHPMSSTLPRSTLHAAKHSKMYLKIAFLDAFDGINESCSQIILTGSSLTLSVAMSCCVSAILSQALAKEMVNLQSSSFFVIYFPVSVCEVYSLRCILRRCCLCHRLHLHCGFQDCPYWMLSSCIKIAGCRTSNASIVL